MNIRAKRERIQALLEKLGQSLSLVECLESARRTGEEVSSEMCDAYREGISQHCHAFFEDLSSDLYSIEMIGSPESRNNIGVVAVDSKPPSFVSVPTQLFDTQVSQLRRIWDESRRVREKDDPNADPNARLSAFVSFVRELERFLNRLRNELTDWLIERRDCTKRKRNEMSSSDDGDLNSVSFSASTSASSTMGSIMHSIKRARHKPLNNLGSISIQLPGISGGITNSYASGVNDDSLKSDIISEMKEQHHQMQQKHHHKRDHKKRRKEKSRALSSSFSSTSPLVQKKKKSRNSSGSSNSNSISNSNSSSSSKGKTIRRSGAKATLWTEEEQKQFWKVLREFGAHSWNQFSILMGTSKTRNECYKYYRRMIIKGKIKDPRYYIRDGEVYTDKNFPQSNLSSEQLGKLYTIIGEEEKDSEPTSSSSSSTSTSTSSSNSVMMMSDITRDSVISAAAASSSKSSNLGGSSTTTTTSSSEIGNSGGMTTTTMNTSTSSSSTTIPILSSVVNSSSQSTTNPFQKPGPVSVRLCWTESEERTFMEIMKENGACEWSRVAEKMPGNKNNDDCHRYWKKLIVEGAVYDPRYIIRDDGKVWRNPKVQFHRRHTHLVGRMFTVLRDPTGVWTDLPAQHPNRPTNAHELFTDLNETSDDDDNDDQDNGGDNDNGDSGEHANSDDASALDTSGVIINGDGVGLLSTNNSMMNGNHSSFALPPSSSSIAHHHTSDVSSRASSSSSSDPTRSLPMLPSLPLRFDPAITGLVQPLLTSAQSAWTLPLFQQHQQPLPPPLLSYATKSATESPANNSNDTTKDVGNGTSTAMLSLATQTMYTGLPQSPDLSSSSSSSMSTIKVKSEPTTLMNTDNNNNINNNNLSNDISLNPKNLRCVSYNIAKTQVYGKWTDREKKLFIERLIEFGARDWREFATVFDGSKNNVQCKTRFNTLLGNGSLSDPQWCRVKNAMGQTHPKRTALNFNEDISGFLFTIEMDETNTFPPGTRHENYPADLLGFSFVPGVMNQPCSPESIPKSLTDWIEWIHLAEKKHEIWKRKIQKKKHKKKKKKKDDSHNNDNNDGNDSSSSSSSSSDESSEILSERELTALVARQFGDHPRRPRRSNSNRNWSRSDCRLFMETLMDLGADDWHEFAKKIPNRTPVQCRMRYRTLIRNGSVKDPRYILIADEDGNLRPRQTQLNQYLDKSISGFLFIVMSDESGMCPPLTRHPKYLKLVGDGLVDPRIVNGQQESDPRSATSTRRSTSSSLAASASTAAVTAVTTGSAPLSSLLN